MKSAVFAILIVCLLSPISWASDLTCSSFFSSVQLTESTLSVVAETDPVNTLFLGYSRGQFNDTHLALLEAIPEDIQVVMLLMEPHEPEEDPDFDKIKTAHPNLKLIRDESWFAKMWTRDWVPRKVIRQDGSIEYVAVASGNTMFAAKFLMEEFGLPYKISDITGEMGNIESDGQGRLFVTEKFFEDNISSYDPSRRDKKVKAKEKEIIKTLKEDFSAEEVIVLPSHPADGNINHIDLVLKYMGNINGEETMLVSDSTDPFVKHTLDKTAEKISKLGYKVIRVMESEEDLGRGALGFINSLVLNDLVIMPTYSAAFKDNPETYKRLIELEANAKTVYESLGYRVIGVDSSIPIKGGGAIHCLTCAAELEK